MPSASSSSASFCEEACVIAKIEKMLVAPSFSEAWCIPAFDAMAMGKTPIVNAAGGMKDFVTKDNGWLVGNSEEPAFGMKDTFHELYSGRRMHRLSCLEIISLHCHWHRWS